MAKVKRKKYTPTFPLPKKVEVSWVDSCTFSKWRDISEYKTVEPLMICSTGYLLRADKHAVTIIQNQDCHGNVGESMTIPRSCVKLIKELK